jgi:Zn-dependent protease with chaperone function
VPTNTKPTPNALKACLMLGTCLALGCSGIQHQAPEAKPDEVQLALAEIDAYRAEPQENPMSAEEARYRLSDVYLKIKPAATETCRHVGESRACAWYVGYGEADSYNAVAMDGNRVVVFHDIIADTDNDDELAFVVAHELGHHIADHLSESKNSRSAGMLAAGVAMAALGSTIGGCTTYACQSSMQNAAQASLQAGAEIGGRVFSVKQEKEADLLAAFIIDQAGFDLAAARNMLLKIGAKTGKDKTAFLASHPAGPERLASFDNAVELVLTDDDGYPGADRPLSDEPEAGPGEPPMSSEASDRRKCRIYLPEQDICIH